MWTIQNPILKKKVLLLAFTFDMRKVYGSVYGNNWNVISDLKKKSLKELRRQENYQKIKKNFKIN